MRNPSLCFVFVCLAASASAQSYWSDPSTGLLWTEQETGQKMSWKGAVKYCQDLRLGGFPEWRLATIEELQRIGDEGAPRHVKGNLRVSGAVWSVTRENFSEKPWQLDFSDGVRSAHGTRERSRAVCVHRPIDDTQRNGFWVDPGTGLMWAARDNGKDVKWGAAAKYCRDLRLAGHADWRLPTIGELERIYDRAIRSQGLVGGTGKFGAEPLDYHVRGGLFLNGRQWSSTKLGHRGGSAWYFDFERGPNQFDHEDSSWMGSPYDRHALCVRQK